MPTKSLPQIETECGALSQPLDEVVASHDIARGFLLTEVDLETIICTNLHKTHRDIAAELLVRCGVLPEALIVDEYPDGKEWGPYTARHIDGLTGRFYQVNTPEPIESSDSTPFNTLHLWRLAASDNQHAYLQDRCVELKQPDAFHTIFVNPLVSSSFFNNLVLQDDPTRLPSLTTTTFGPASTVVFPNGYDARPDSLPSDVYVHAVQSSSDMAGTPSESAVRFVTMSRVENPAA